MAQYKNGDMILYSFEGVEYFAMIFNQTRLIWIYKKKDLATYAPKKVNKLGAPLVKPKQLFILYNGESFHSVDSFKIENVVRHLNVIHVEEDQVPEDLSAYDGVIFKGKEILNTSGAFEKASKARVNFTTFSTFRKIFLPTSNWFNKAPQKTDSNEEEHGWKYEDTDDEDGWKYEDEACFAPNVRLMPLKMRFKLKRFSPY